MLFLMLDIYIKFWKVGDKLAKEAKYAAIYASDLKRASETAQIIATTCNVPEVCLMSSAIKMCFFSADVSLFVVCVGLHV